MHILRDVWLWVERKALSIMVNCEAELTKNTPTTIGSKRYHACDTSTHASCGVLSCRGCFSHELEGAHTLCNCHNFIKLYVLSSFVIVDGNIKSWEHDTYANANSDLQNANIQPCWSHIIQYRSCPVKRIQLCRILKKVPNDIRFAKNEICWTKKINFGYVSRSRLKLKLNRIRGSPSFSHYTTLAFTSCDYAFGEFACTN